MQVENAVLTITLNPYQGLKLFNSPKYWIDSKTYNYLESLSGIETMDAPTLYWTTDAYNYLESLSGIETVGHL